MAVYNIYLLDYTFNGMGFKPDIGGSNLVDLSASIKSSIKSQLQMNFELICHGSKLNPVVQWGYPSKVGDQELIGYFLENRDNSLINWKKLGTAGRTSAGLTAYSTSVGRISEIYSNMFIKDPVMLADLCLHEFLHNKLEMRKHGKIDIHHEDTGGYGQDQLEPGKYTLTKKIDIAAMLKALSESLPQYLIPVSDYKSALSSPLGLGM